MSEEVNNPPAFAVPFTRFETWCHGRIPVHGHPGMSLRDYFAGAALPTVMAVMDAYAKSKGIVLEPSDVAKTAYWYADAMLRERLKYQEPTKEGK